MARHSCRSRSQSRSAKGEGKQRTTGKGKGKDEEPRNVAQLQRLRLVRFILTDINTLDTPWTDADYVEAATSLWGLVDDMEVVLVSQGRIGCAERMDKWLEDRREGLVGDWLVLKNDDSPGD